MSFECFVTACDGRVTTPTVESAFRAFGSCNRCGLEYQRDEPAYGEGMDDAPPWLLVGPVTVAYRDAIDGMMAEIATDVTIEPPGFRMAGEPWVEVVPQEIISIEPTP